MYSNFIDNYTVMLSFSYLLKWNELIKLSVSKYICKLMHLKEI